MLSVIITREECVSDNSNDLNFLYQLLSLNQNISLPLFFEIDAVYVMHPNWLYWLAWPLIKQFVSTDVKEAVQILSYPEDIHQFVDPTELAEEQRGSRHYVHNYQSGMYKLP